MRITLGGPIEYWWDENWETVEHWDYVAWREAVNDTLVGAKHLVYRPHEAYKGEWDLNDGDRFSQPVNEAAIRSSDVFLNLDPPGIPSEGTDDELKFCADEGVEVIAAPPPYALGKREETPRAEIQAALAQLLEQLALVAVRGDD